MGHLRNFEDDKNLPCYRRIQLAEVDDALKKTRNGKAVVPDNISFEAWKYLRKEGIM